MTDFQSARMASKHIVTTRNENHTSHVTQRSFFAKKFKKKKKRVKKAFFWKNGKKNTLLRVSLSIANGEIRVRVVLNKRWNFQKNPSTGSMIYPGGVQFFRTKKRSKMPFLAVFGHFWPFLAIFDRFKLQQRKCLHKNGQKRPKNDQKSKAVKNWIFYRFWGRKMS